MPATEKGKREKALVGMRVGNREPASGTIAAAAFAHNGRTGVD